MRVSAEGLREPGRVQGHEPPGDHDEADLSPFHYEEPDGYRIWLDDKELRYAIVDWEDYVWALQWLWGAKPNSRGKVFYAYRAANSGEVRYRARPNRPGLSKDYKVISVFLHVEIMKRTGKRRPTKAHTIVDHKNRDSLDCRRRNLRWATVSMNNHNRTGYVVETT
jgi:hypothetical protein